MYFFISRSSKGFTVMRRASRIVFWVVSLMGRAYIRVCPVRLQSSETRSLQSLPSTPRLPPPHPPCIHLLISPPLATHIAHSLLSALINMAVTKTNKSTKSTKANKNKSRVQRAAPAQSIRRSDRLPHIQPAPQPASTPSVSTGDHTTTTDPSLQQAAIITIPEEHCESVDTKLQYVADMRKVDVSLLKLQLPTAAEVRQGVLYFRVELLLKGVRCSVRGISHPAAICASTMPQAKTVSVVQSGTMKLKGTWGASRWRTKSIWTPCWSGHFALSLDVGRGT